MHPNSSPKSRSNRPKDSPSSESMRNWSKFHLQRAAARSKLHSQKYARHGSSCAWLRKWFCNYYYLSFEPTSARLRQKISLEYLLPHRPQTWKCFANGRPPRWNARCWRNFDRTELQLRHTRIRHLQFDSKLQKQIASWCFPKWHFEWRRWCIFARAFWKWIVMISHPFIVRSTSCSTWRNNRSHCCMIL